MNWLIRIFHFLGGIYFAILLITVTACFVILGTILEARFDSHLYAAQWTYNNPLFGLLLGLFFINILFSALRRWPFRIRHIPFLTTHFGLLMILTGCIIKQWYGVQGIMLITEGSGNQQVLIPHSHALHIEKKDSPMVSTIPVLTNYHTNLISNSFSKLHLKVMNLLPHVSQKMETWIKGNRAYISGLPPLPVQEWSSAETPFIVTSLPIQKQRWDIVILRTDDLQQAIEQAYLYQTQIKVQAKEEPLHSIEMPLRQIISEVSLLFNGQSHAHLSLPYSVEKGFENPVLILDWKMPASEHEEKIQIALNGNLALYSTLVDKEQFTIPSFDIDIARPRPLLLIVEDLQGDCHLFAFDKHGRVHGEPFCQSTLRSFMMYEGGYGGYGVQANVPFPLTNGSRKEKEKADLHALSTQIEQAMITNPILAPPLNLLKKACEKSSVVLTPVLLDFLTLWHQTHRPLMPLEVELNPILIQVLQQIDWKAIPFEDFQACQWTNQLITKLEQPWFEGASIRVLLRKNRWPFIKELEESVDSKNDIFTALAQQMFAFASRLPTIPLETHLSPNQQARLLSAYFKAYGIEYRLLNLLSPDKEENFSNLERYRQSLNVELAFLSPLETSLTMKSVPKPPSLKIEDNCPCLLLEAEDSENKQTIALTYDRLGNGLKQPLLYGKYLVRFQPIAIDIPYRIRLKEARKINFADSNQPYSYESDIIVYERGSEKEKDPIRKTLSMNHVYETWDGYRFYLANITSLESGLKRVQLAVNYDPAKYYLTYPGGLIVTLGILLLFWMQPYRKQRFR